MDTDHLGNHDDVVRRQFTATAIPFMEAARHATAIETLVSMSGVGTEDRVLDVACGPGLVACELAKVARHVTGIDLTEEMITQATKRAAEFGLDNVTWEVGSAVPLPDGDASYSTVVTRYSFHHLLDPAAALREMIRVCERGGVVLVADVDIPDENANAFNRMEKLRDPSHARALTSSEWEQLLQASGLADLARASYVVDTELEAQLAASAPAPGGAEQIRAMFEDDLTTQAMGVATRRVENEIWFSYPISIFTGRKA